MDTSHISWLHQWNGVKSQWPADMPAAEAHPSFLVLGEPFTTPVDALLQDIRTRYPGAPAIGGMASAAHQPGQNRLVFNEARIQDGVVGVALAGVAYLLVRRGRLAPRTA